MRARVTVPLNRASDLLLVVPEAGCAFKVHTACTTRDVYNLNTGSHAAPRAWLSRLLGRIS